MSQQGGPFTLKEGEDLVTSDPIGLDVGGASFASTSTTQTEALEYQSGAYTALKRYVTAEVDSYKEGWLLLGRCNKLLQDGCKEVERSAREAMHQLEATAKSMEILHPKLVRIDAIELQLSALTGTVNMIDEYSKVLADQFGCGKEFHEG